MEVFPKDYFIRAAEKLIASFRNLCLDRNSVCVIKIVIRKLADCRDGSINELKSKMFERIMENSEMLLGS